MVHVISNNRLQNNLEDLTFPVDPFFSEYICGSQNSTPPYLNPPRLELKSRQYTAYPVGFKLLEYGSESLDGKK